jgi:hypothetical protein
MPTNEPLHNDRTAQIDRFIARIQATPVELKRPQS